MSRWARCGVLATVAVLGVLAAGGEASAFSRERAFRSCFRFPLGTLGDTDVVLQLAGERGSIQQIVGTASFAETVGRATVPVTGVARQRTGDADLDVNFSFGFLFTGTPIQIQVIGRLTAPDFDSGSGAFILVAAGPTIDDSVTFTTITCPTTFGDFG